MIHVRLDGQQISGNQNTLVSDVPYNSDDYSDPVTVGAAAVHVITPSAVVEERDYIRLRNISTAGQVIYLDTVNTVTSASFTDLLYPGEWVDLINIDLDIWAIADAAAGKLSRRGFSRTG